MAPNFRHGKDALLLFNNALLTGSTSGILTSVTLQASVEAPDTTVIGQSDRTFKPGLRTGTIRFDGLMDGSAPSTASTGTTGAKDTKFASALGASTTPRITYGPEGNTIGRRAVLVAANQTAYGLVAVTDDIVKFSAENQFTGRQDYGHIHLTLAARTSTSSTFASVDSGVAAGTTGGGVAHHHVIAMSTVTSYVVKIQHSSLAVSWADLISFTNTTGTTEAQAVQRSTVSGTVKRYTRAIISTFSGGGGKSVTSAAAFARRRYPTF